LPNQQYQDEQDLKQTRNFHPEAKEIRYTLDFNKVFWAVVDHAVFCASGHGQNLFCVCVQ
jgi:hypothetical protein